MRYREYPVVCMVGAVSSCLVQAVLSVLTVVSALFSTGCACCFVCVNGAVCTVWLMALFALSG